MDFIILRIFSDFFYEFIFYYKLIKMNLKRQKVVYIRAGPRGCDVALRAMWQRHAGPRGVYTFIIIIL